MAWTEALPLCVLHGELSTLAEAPKAPLEMQAQHTQASLIKGLTAIALLNRQYTVQAYGTEGSKTHISFMNDWMLQNK